MHDHVALSFALGSLRRQACAAVLRHGSSLP
jgi:hypothetical protein